MRKNTVSYEKFHNSTSVQTKVITKNNFTYKIILEVIEDFINSSKNILDIGSGAGTLCLYYASKGYNVFGIDVSRKAVDSANKSAEYLGFKNAKFRKMNFPQESPKERYDFIVFTEVIEHLEDDYLALKKIFSL